MRTLITLIALLIGTAGLAAQEPDQIEEPPPEESTPGSMIPPIPPSDAMIGPIVAVVCGVAILFAVCFPMRRDD